MNKIISNSIATRPYADQIFCIHDGYTVEVCRRPDSMATAFRLRYRAYSAVDAIEDNEEELLYDDFDFLPNARIHLVWYKGKPVATVRSCIWSDQYDWIRTEGINYFQTDIQNKLGTQTRLLESNRYAVDPDFQGRQSLFAQILMFRIHGLSSAVHGCNYIITSVRQNHVPFYCRFLGMEVISEETHYIPWVHAEVSLLVAERKKSHQIALRRGLPEIHLKDIELYANCAEIPFSKKHRIAA